MALILFLVSLPKILQHMGTKEKLIERFLTLPHPSNIIKGYVLKQMLAFIKENKLLEEFEKLK